MCVYILSRKSFEVTLLKFCLDMIKFFSQLVYVNGEDLFKLNMMGKIRDFLSSVIDDWVHIVVKLGCFLY